MKIIKKLEITDSPCRCPKCGNLVSAKWVCEYNSAGITSKIYFCAQCSEIVDFSLNYEIIKGDPCSQKIIDSIKNSNKTN